MGHRGHAAQMLIRTYLLMDVMMELGEEMIAHRETIEGDVTVARTDAMIETPGP